MGVTPATSYHHGDLPNALRHAAVEVIAERGLGSFSLREVARRAGVSHTAPAHHFGDMRGLLTSVATEGFDMLYAATTSACDGIDDPVERLIALGQAYVTLARSDPGHFEVMFRTDVVDLGDVQMITAGMRAYAVLQDAIRSVIDDQRLTVDLDDATWLCWSMVQGLVALGQKLDVIGTLSTGAGPSTDDLVERFTTMIVAGFRDS